MLDSVSNVRIYGKFDILHQSVMSAKILSPSNNAKKQKTVNLFLTEKKWAGDWSLANKLIAATTEIDLFWLSQRLTLSLDYCIEAFLKWVISDL